MNARQLKKRMKKEMRSLKTDNNLMRNIIANSPQMQELYDKYNKPLNVTQSTMQFKEYRVSRIVIEDVPQYYEMCKDELATELLERVKDQIVYEVNSEESLPRIAASIFLGRE